MNIVLKKLENKDKGRYSVCLPEKKNQKLWNFTMNSMNPTLSPDIFHKTYHRNELEMVQNNDKNESMARERDTQSHSSLTVPWLLFSQLSSLVGHPFKATTDFPMCIHCEPGSTHHGSN